MAGSTFIVSAYVMFINDMNWVVKYVFGGGGKLLVKPVLEVVII